ncbi:MAG: c-type cytochrome [Nitrosomonadales bacterium]|nr:c-type cytochrome [Nitrosomonadales bacterium]
MNAHYTIAMMAALAVSASAFAAADGEALFNKNKCSTCHKLDNKTVGPTLKDIAAKYAGDKDAPAKLEAKVRSGGGGVWGSVPMPRTPAAVSDEEIKTTVAWMLSHHK